MRYRPFIGDDEREAARYGGSAEQDALARRSGLCGHEHKKPAATSAAPAPKPASPVFLDSRALVQQAALGNPQAAAQLATIKLQLSQRAAKGDMQSAALLQKIQGFEIQAAVAAQSRGKKPAPAAPGMPPGYGPPDDMAPDEMPPGVGPQYAMPPGMPPGYAPGTPPPPPGYPPPGYPPQGDSD
jgi:hypothetical protein